MADIKIHLDALVERNRIYRTKVATIAILFSLCVPLVFALDDLISGAGMVNMPRYLLAFLWLSALLSFALLRPSARFLHPAILATALAGFFIALRQPNPRYIYLLILMSYPLLSFQLAGFRRGAAAVAVFTLALLFDLALSYGTVYSRVLCHRPATIWLVLTFSFLVVTLISAVGVRYYEKYVEDMVDQLTIDAATGLPNRQVLSYEIGRGAVDRLYVLRFENYMELKLSLGEKAGAEVLRKFGERLRTEGDFRSLRAYKLRGRDFCLARSDRSGDRRALEVEARRLSSIFGGVIFPTNGLKLRALVRICALEVQGCGAAELLELADASLRNSARSNERLVFGTDAAGMAEGAAESGRLFSVLADNIEGGTLKAYFQPIVDATTKEVGYHELLLRVRERDGSYVSPLRYLDVAESTGLDESIASFVLCEAESMIERTGLPVSVNIGANQLRSSSFLDGVEGMMLRDAKKRGKLILELLERQDPSSLEGAELFIRRARDLGCLISIDDFGSGYANFMNLLFMEADIVKLEGRLIEESRRDDRIRGLIEGVVGYCRRIGAKVVAEWVDDPDLAETLAGMGIDYLQGFLYGRPRSYDEDPVGRVAACRDDEVLR